MSKFTRTGSKYKVHRHEVIQPEDPSIKLIALTRDQSAITDAEDFEDLDKINWSAFWNHKTHSFYARAPYGPPLFGEFMHRFLLKVHDSPLDVDHVNGNTLDNRKSNLREATRSLNILHGKIRKTNTSGTPGVYWHSSAKKWAANIRVNGICIYLGSFTEKVAAIAARKEAEQRYCPGFEPRGNQ